MGFSRRIGIKVPDMKFDGNMCSGSGAVPPARRTDKGKPIGVSHGCTNALQVRRAADFHETFMSGNFTKKNVATPNFVCVGES